MSSKDRDRSLAGDMPSVSATDKSRILPIRPSTSSTSYTPSGNAFAASSVGHSQSRSDGLYPKASTSSSKPPTPKSKPIKLQIKPTVSTDPSAGSAWKYRQPVVTPTSIQASRLAKIKSSPAQGALAAARQAESHGRLHKRGGSLSAVQSQTSPKPFRLNPQPVSTVDHGQASTSIMTRREPLPDVAPVASLGGSSVPKTKTKIKPLLRRLKSQEEYSLDLSRSAAEHDGLGLYGDDTGPSYFSVSDMASISSGKRGRTHGRSTSGASQVSTATTSSGNRQYVHPMRQTPRPYTPPIAASYHASTLAGEAMDPEEERRLRQIQIDSSYVAPRGDSPPPPPLPVFYSHQHSSAGLLNRSQSNLPGTPSSGHFPGGASSPADTMSPTSRRSSIEKIFTKRSRTISDPATRAASIQAARMAFNEREAIKELKAEQEEIKALEREMRRKEKIEAAKVKTKHSRPEFDEKDDEVVAGREYSTFAPTAAEANESSAVGRAGRKSKLLKKPKAPQWWMEFVIWFKTRLYKMRRTVGRKVLGKK